VNPRPIICKTFISFVGKWEIGAPFTHVLVCDGFEAFKQLTGSGWRTGRRCVVVVPFLPCRLW
jgi:hypothetical protein